MPKYLFYNAQVISPLSINPGQVLVEDGIIKQVDLNPSPEGRPFLPAKVSPEANLDKLTPEDREDLELIDCKGLYLSPGFIESHVHGGGGYDFMDGDIASIEGACLAHLAHGTTSIVPTTITSTRESMMDTLRLFNEVEPDKPGHPSILGLHLEGPYFSPLQAGAQDPKYLRNPDPDEYEEALAITDRIIRWSFAVELPGSERFLKVLREHHIATSVAHSNASYQEVEAAYENGVSCLTHFYSAMSTVTRRNAFRVGGVVEAGYLIDDLYVEAITDGCHLPPELLRLIYKVKGADRIILVTDAMRGAGMPDGTITKLGNITDGMDCIIEDGVAKLMDRSAFAGSVATSDRLVRTFRQATRAPLEEVVRMISLNPAKLMGVHNRKGSIAIGKDADLLVFDEDINIEKIMVRGEMIKR